MVWKKIRQGKYEIHWFNDYQEKFGGIPTNVFIEKATTPDFPKSKYDVWVVHGDGGVVIYHATSLTRAIEEAKIYMKNHPKG